MSTTDSEGKQLNQDNSSDDQENIELDIPEIKDESDDEFIVISSEPDSVEPLKLERNDFGVLTKTFELSEDEAEDDFDEPMLDASVDEDSASLVGAEGLADEPDIDDIHDNYIETPPEMMEEEHEKVLELQLDKPLVLSDVLNEKDFSENIDEDSEDKIVVESEEYVEDESVEEIAPNTADAPKPGSRITWLMYPIALVGIILRVLWYMKNSALDAQESALSHALFSRSFPELFQPLGEGQIAPVGFLIKVKMQSLLFGDNEYILRMYSLVVSIIAIILFVWFIRKLVEPMVAILAVALLSLSFPLIDQAATLSPWSGDLMAATLMLLLGTQCIKQTPSMKFFILLAIVGIILPWFSLPFIFILGGIGLTLFMDALGVRDGTKIKRIALLNILWLVGFIVHYFISLKPFLNDSTLHDTYAAYFLPLPSTGGWFSSIYWLGERSTAIFVDPLGILLPGLGLFSCLLGCVVLARTQRVLLMMILLPFVGILIASALGLFPMHVRFLQCLAPGLAITCAVGLSGLVHLLWVARRRAALFLIALIFVPNAVVTTHAVLKAKDEGIKPALEHCLALEGTQIPIYIDAALHNQFQYYTRANIDLNPDVIQLGEVSSDEWAAYDKVLLRFQEQPRVWFLLQNEDEQISKQYLLNRLNRMGSIIIHEQWGNVHLYQYDLTVEPIQKETEIDSIKTPEPIGNKVVTVEPNGTE